MNVRHGNRRHFPGADAGELKDLVSGWAMDVNPSSESTDLLEDLEISPTLRGGEPLSNTS